MSDSVPTTFGPIVWRQIF